MAAPAAKGKREGPSALHHLRVTSLHLGRLDLLDLVADVPLVPEGVAYGAGSFSVEMILGLAHHGGAGAHGAGDRFVRVVHVKMDADAGAADALGAVDAVLGILVREHDG